MNPEAKIVSFVVRFVYDGDPGKERGEAAKGNWYSIIRHVQSDVERHFTNWAEIEGFIGSYIDLSLGKDAKNE